MEPPYGDTVGMAAHSASTVYSGEPNCGPYDAGVYGGICHADLDDIVDSIWQGEESREDQYTVQEASEEEHQEGQEYGGGIFQRDSNNNSAHMSAHMSANNLDNPYQVVVPKRCGGFELDFVDERFGGEGFGGNEEEREEPYTQGTIEYERDDGNFGNVRLNNTDHNNVANQCGLAGGHFGIGSAINNVNDNYVSNQYGLGGGHFGSVSANNLNDNNATSQYDLLGGNVGRVIASNLDNAYNLDWRRKMEASTSELHDNPYQAVVAGTSGAMGVDVWGGENIGGQGFGVWGGENNGEQGFAARNLEESREDQRPDIKDQQASKVGGGIFNENVNQDDYLTRVKRDLKRKRLDVSTRIGELTALIYYEADNEMDASPSASKEEVKKWNSDLGRYKMLRTHVDAHLLSISTSFYWQLVSGSHQSDMNGWEYREPEDNNVDSIYRYDAVSVGCKPEFTDSTSIILESHRRDMKNVDEMPYSTFVPLFFATRPLSETSCDSQARRDDLEPPNYSLARQATSHPKAKQATSPEHPYSSQKLGRKKDQTSAFSFEFFDVEKVVKVNDDMMSIMTDKDIDMDIEILDDAEVAKLCEQAECIGRRECLAHLGNHGELVEECETEIMAFEEEIKKIRDERGPLIQFRNVPGVPKKKENSERALETRIAVQDAMLAKLSYVTEHKEDLPDAEQDFTLAEQFDGAEQNITLGEQFNAMEQEGGLSDAESQVVAKNGKKAGGKGKHKKVKLSSRPVGFDWAAHAEESEEAEKIDLSKKRARWLEMAKAGVLAAHEQLQREIRESAWEHIWKVCGWWKGKCHNKSKKREREQILKILLVGEASKHNHFFDRILIDLERVKKVEDVKWACETGLALTLRNEQAVQNWIKKLLDFRVENRSNVLSVDQKRFLRASIQNIILRKKEQEGPGRSRLEATRINTIFFYDPNEESDEESERLSQV